MSTRKRSRRLWSFGRLRIPPASTTRDNRQSTILVNSRGGNIYDKHDPGISPSSLSCIPKPDDSSMIDQNNKDHANNNNLDNASIEPSNNNKGRLLLLLVAVLYGTLNVSLRLVYGLPNPPSASVLSATRGWLATACFIPPLLFSKRMKEQEQTKMTTAKVKSSSASSFVMLKAATELAVWNFGAQGLLSLGLLSTGSARASFLTQTSVILTPLVSLVAGQAIPSTIGVASLLALFGLVLLCGGGAGAGFAVAVSGGDLLVLGGALCWSLYLIRLTQLADQFHDDEVSLQAMKTTLLAVLYSVWVGVSLWSSSSADIGSMNITSMVSLLGGWVKNPVAWILLLYSAVGPGTVADIVQQQGQKQVATASEANIILSLEPVFTAVFALLIMGETTSLLETLGGGMILLAAVVATNE